MRNDVTGLDDIPRPTWIALSRKLGRRTHFPRSASLGLDGHSNGAEQIAVRARDAGMQVVLRGHSPDAGGDRRRGAQAKRPMSSAYRSFRAAICRWSRMSSAA